MKNKAKHYILPTILLFVTVFLIHVTPVFAQANSTVTISPKFSQTDARSMLNMINSFRTGSDAWYWNESNTQKIQVKGLNPVTYDYNLEKIAMQRAAEIAILYSHTRPDNTPFHTAYNIVSTFYMTCGENISAGYNSVTSPNEAFDLWLEAEEPYSGQGHRRNMLYDEFNTVGIAHVTYNGREFWVQEFGKTTELSSSTTAVNSILNTDINLDTTIINSKNVTPAYTSKTLTYGESTSVPSARMILTINNTLDWLENVPILDTFTYRIEDTSIATLNNNTITTTGIGSTRLAIISNTFGTISYVPITVNPIDLTDAIISLSETSVLYDGTKKEIPVSVTLNNKTLTANTDYSISYKNNTDAGTAYVIITGKGIYTGTATKSFQITKPVSTPTPTPTPVPIKPVPQTSSTINVSKISIIGDSQNIAAGKKLQLNATVIPESASNKTITWTSSNNKIATVSSNGLVTVKAKTGGKSVIITAKAADDSNVYAKYTIKSMKGIVKNIKIKGQSTVKAGKSTTLKVHINSTKGANTKLVWRTSNSKYAKVNSKGKVTTYKKGKKKTVTITATATDGSGKKASFKIKIK